MGPVDAGDYLLYARKLARPYKANHPDLADDLESAACLALVQAARDFRPDRGIKFATFAGTRITFALRDEVRRQIGARRRSVPASSGLELDDLANVPDSDPVADADAFERLATLAGGLAPVVRLIYRDGLDGRGAARRLGCSPSVVYRDKTIALDRIRRRLAVSPEPERCPA